MEKYPLEEGFIFLYHGGEIFAWISAVSLTLAVTAIIISLSLYNFLAAANFPDDDDNMLQEWIAVHYPFIVAELISTVLSALLQWFNFYFLGLMRIPTLDYYNWAIVGIIGWGVVIVMFIFLAVLHFFKTVPRIRKEAAKLNNQDEVAPLEKDIQLRKAGGGASDDVHWDSVGCTDPAKEQSHEAQASEQRARTPKSRNSSRIVAWNNVAAN